ncbi:MAG: glycosyltransferase [Oscillospiraceae bacterium]|nr:glycosyltransferase [Oscillospiraceae bacterium]
MRFYDVSDVFSGFRLFTENRDSISRETYFRIVIPWIIHPDYKTAVYFDGDMIIRHDANDIFQFELGKAYIAAVRDYWGICTCYIPGDKTAGYRRSLGLDDMDGYVISATLLFNLSLWRKSFILEEVLHLCASREWYQHDQDVINVLCKDRIVYLPSGWGMMQDYGNNHYLPEYLLRELEEYQDDPFVIHFGGNRKPYISRYKENGYAGGSSRRGCFFMGTYVF